MDRTVNRDKIPNLLDLLMREQETSKVKGKKHFVLGGKMFKEKNKAPKRGWQYGRTGILGKVAEKAFHRQWQLSKVEGPG